MKISAILCTYNRSASLAKVLDDLAASKLPESVEWEILVIDNNSRDRTREVVDGFVPLFGGRLRYIFEPQQGLSNARNRGIRESRGDILAFVDDDVAIDPSWFHNLTYPLRDGEWAGSGGRTLPASAFSLPEWLSGGEPLQWGGILGGLFDMGDAPRELALAPYGANMAFRKEMFKKYGGFRTDLGRRPGSLIGNEDTEFGRRLMAAGERLRYVPSAVVYHGISQDRLQKKYFLKWWFDYGRARIREAGVRPKVWGIPRKYFSVPNYIVRILPTHVLRWLFTFNRPRRFYNRCLAWAAAGEMVEIWRQSARSSSPQSQVIGDCCGSTPDGENEDHCHPVHV